MAGWSAGNSWQRGTKPGKPVAGGLESAGTSTTRAILTRLARAREWTVVVRDGTGREVAREMIYMPAPAAVEAAYRGAKPRVDAMVADYRNACSARPY